MSGAEGAGARRAVCAGCGCLCDDLPLDDPPHGRGEPNVETDCDLGRAWFASRVFGRAREPRPPEIAGETADPAAAAERAAELLSAGRHPLVTGLGALALAGQRRLVEVADRIGGSLDLDVDDDGLGTRLAVHRDGGPFVTLGEIRERADCLVLWYVRPDRTHPRLLERFYPSRSGGGDRAVVAVGPGAEETDADLAVPADREDALPLLWLVRLLVDDPEAPEGRSHALAGPAAELADRLRGASWGAWLYPGGGAAGGADPVEVAGVVRLLARLNDRAPWGARPVRGAGNPVGAETVLTWQAGYPGPVAFREGVPRYDGGAAGRGRARVDVALLAGGRPESLSLPEGAPCVWLDAGAPAEGGGADPEGGRAGAEDGRAADVRIPILPAGAVEGDTLLRMDGLAVRSAGIPALADGPAVPAEEALRAILAALPAGGPAPPSPRPGGTDRPAEEAAP